MNRDAYLKKLKYQLDEWSADIDRLEAKAKSAGQDVRIKYQNEIKDIRGKMNKAREKFEEIQSAGEDKWESLKDEAEEFWSRIKGAVEHAKAAIK